MKKSNQLSLPFPTDIKAKPNRNDASPIKLSELKSHGISLATPLSAKVILELGRRYSDEPDFILGPIESPTDVYSLFKDEMNGITGLAYKLIAVNTKHMVTTTKLLPKIPTIQQTMRWTVSHSAAALFLCRNNPFFSNFTPEEGRWIREIAQVDTIIGIDFLDFVLSGATGYFSARVEGLL